MDVTRIEENERQTILNETWSRTIVPGIRGIGLSLEMALKSGYRHRLVKKSCVC